MQNKKKILVVDDKEFNVEILTDILEDAGYKVLQAYSGEESLNIIEEELPDAILLDIMMPSMSGFEVCEKLKDNKAYCNIPIIFISALDSVDNKIKGLDIGANDYITKPFNPDEVIARTGVAIRLKDMQDEIDKQATELKRKNKQIENELQVAMKIQRNLLPISIVDYMDQRAHVHYKNNGITVSGCYIPCESLGGDLYDVTVENNTLFLSTVDVSGHGAPSSLITIMYKMLFNEYTEICDFPSDIAEIINDKLYKLVFTQYYATAIIAALDLNTNIFSYTRAGHPYPILYQQEHNRATIIREGSLPLAMFEHTTFETHKIKLSRGDKLLTYTDGITDVLGMEGSANGDEILRTIFLESAQNQDTNIIGSILNKMHESSPDKPFHDDVTMLLVEVS